MDNANNFPPNYEKYPHYQIYSFRWTPQIFDTKQKSNYRIDVQAIPRYNTRLKKV